MALDVLLQAIAADGDAEARALVDAARARADAIRAAADVRAEQRCADALASREVALRMELDARRAAAVRDARERVLRARAAFLERIFTAAAQDLPGVLDEPSSGSALERLCREAVDCFPDIALRIRCRSGLAAALLIDGNWSGRAEVVADDTVPEGVIVESADGAVRVDNTLIARMTRLRPSLSIALLHAVAPGGTA